MLTLTRAGCRSTPRTRELHERSRTAREVSFLARYSTIDRRARPHPRFGGEPERDRMAKGSGVAPLFRRSGRLLVVVRRHLAALDRRGGLSLERGGETHCFRGAFRPA